MIKNYILLKKIKYKNLGIKIRKIIIFLGLSIICSNTIFTIQSDKYLKLINPKNKINGSLNSDFLSYFKKLFKSDTFVETGTFLGVSTLKAADIFKYVYTIELSKNIYEKAKENLKNKQNIKLFHGDSSEIMSLFLPNIKNNSIMFWLDGHFSYQYQGHMTAKGETASPVLKELENIKKCQINDSLILIDDIRIFDKSYSVLDHHIVGCFPNVNEVCKLIYDINKNYNIVIYGDILLAYIENDIQVSDLIKACTISRLYNEKNYSLDEVIKAEKIIGNCYNEEFNALLDLNAQFKKINTGKYYKFWIGLRLFYKKDFNNSYKIFKEVLNYGINDMRIKYYLDICKKRVIKE